MEVSESLEERERLATLHVQRTSARDCTHRIIKVFLDEAHISTLNFGDEIEVKVPPGLHSITVDNTWKSTTTTIAFHPNEILVFETGNTASGCAMTLLFTVGVSPLGLFLEPVNLAVIADCDEIVRA